MDDDDDEDDESYQVEPPSHDSIEEADLVPSEKVFILS